MADDTNGADDIFLRDNSTGAVQRVSVADDESQATGGSFLTGLSANGRFVAFKSFAANLVTGDTNSAADLFVRDMTNGTTVRVNVTSAGLQAVYSSPLGFLSDSLQTAISDDGRFVAFRSSAINLVAGDTNLSDDIFLRDTVMSATTRASVTSGGLQVTGEFFFGLDISSDGTRIAFASTAALVPEDSNGSVDVFVRDTVASTTTRASVSTSGAQPGGYGVDISSSGRFVTFITFNTVAMGDPINALPYYRHDLSTGSTQAWDSSLTGPVDSFAASDDGSRVAWVSNNGTKLFTRAAGATTPVFVATLGPECDCAPQLVVSTNTVHFDSTVADLVPSDTNSALDVFRYSESLP